MNLAEVYREEGTLEGSCVVEGGGKGEEGKGETGDPFDIYCGDACRADIIICTTRIIQAGR